MLNDINQRLLATDPSQSFIVQAPAGSGKTEILTQRFLRLLATVQSPEQIIALTFTRKAANEMRERILSALQKAANGETPLSSHQQQTYHYANEALKRDKALNWQLLNQPGRLRVLTIDSLCQRLIQAMPLQDKPIPYAQICDKPQKYYSLAARACLNFAVQDPNYQPSLKCLLHHLDNQQERLLELFSELLAKRDQWLEPLYQAKLQDKEQFEDGLSWIESHELARFCKSLPSNCSDMLIHLVRRLALLDTAPEDIQSHFQQWSSLEEIDRVSASTLANVLLTTQNKLRKGFDYRVGLKRGVCSDEEYQALKAESEALFEQLNTQPDFIEALLRIKNLPAPEYDPHQWDVLQALFMLLPILAAHLQIIFNDHNEVDFSAISRQALQALGDEQNPTDLTLYLDHHIQHLLVDEFQDTSIQQFELLTKIVQEWQENDGKTLFVVGDPMQSIYRFRSAEVGLFLRAQRYGIGTVKLTPLELTANFRSTGTIVDWVNQQFNAIFPATDDIESGAVSFHPSERTQDSDPDTYIKAKQFSDKIQEAQAIVNLAKYELEHYPNDQIAILVRSRNDLKSIINRLRDENIPFQGTDIDSLVNLPHLRDAWSLTQALLMPANRLAWLSFLRSPWCGLSLSDLHALANVQKSKSIYSALSQAKNIPTLSDEGKTRCHYIYLVLHNALNHRYQHSLVDWVSDTLTALYARDLLIESEQDDLEQFWHLLRQFENNGQIEDWEQFQAEFKRLYSKRVTPSRLQIMTIHKSKGLEFDSVVLPGLSGKSANNDKPLLRWLKLPTEHHDLFLVSPVKAAHHEQCLVFDYLAKLDNEKSDYETQRLLYVAATRTKKRLHLFDHRDKGSKGSFRHLFQAVDFEDTNSLNEPATSLEDSTSLPILYHLPINYYQSPPTIRNDSFSNLQLTDHLNPARLIGVITHELMQWICNNHPTHITEIPWTLTARLLKQNGFSQSEHEILQNRLKTQISHLFNDPIGQWLIKSHNNERNEYELFVDVQGEPTTRIIDRTFVENGIRWIIDFKTGAENNDTTKEYKQQVNDYAQIMTSRSKEPIRCGLYYLSGGHWVAWEY